MILIYIRDKTCNFYERSSSVEFVVIPGKVLDVISNINYIKSEMKVPYKCIIIDLNLLVI